MRKIKRFRGNALQVESFNFSADSGLPVLEALVTIVSLEEDQASVVGHSQCSTWSEETRKKLGEFLDQLEKDACSQLGEGSRAASGRLGILEELREE